MKKKIAFVAMKYEDSAWRDKRYQVIREGLEEAGFDVIRADEIKTSGPVVNEVCDYFKNADLVVIDSTGDSHSVSYEIGYCHGINRDTQSTILLKKYDDKQIPFNFRHFRHQYYKDLRHLRRLIREWFLISIPIHPDEHGFVFNFNVANSSTSAYGLPCAEVLVDFIKTSKFSGRCEFYAGDSYVGYIKGIGLKYKNGKTPEYKFWLTAKEFITQNISKYDPGITLEISEFASIREMKESFIPCGIVQFENGMLQRILNPDSSANDTWFIMALNERQNENGA
jgi:hypothetical protein